MMFLCKKNIAGIQLWFSLYRLMEVLKKLATGEEKIDMTRMSNLIHRKVLDSLSAVSCKLLLTILLPNQILSLTPKT